MFPHRLFCAGPPRLSAALAKQAIKDLKKHGATVDIGLEGLKEHDAICSYDE